MKMPKPIRFQMFLTFITDNNSVTMKQLLSFSNEKGFTQITTRRDISELIQSGFIENQLGLYKCIEKNNEEVSRDKKKTLNLNHKREIARYINKNLEQLSDDTSCIFFGSGTTIEELVKAIDKPIEKLYTYGIEVARAAGINQNIKEIYLVGGEYRRQSHAVTGEFNHEQLKNVIFTSSFFTGTHMLEDGYTYNNNQAEAKLINDIIGISRKKYFLLDSSKFSLNIGGVRVARTEILDGIITDGGIREDEDNLVKIKNIIIAE